MSADASLRRILHLTAGILVMLAVSRPTSAQTTTASLTGTVRTAEGIPVAGVTVDARSHATGITRSALTGKDGRYRIDLLQPGAWTITAHRGEEKLGDPRTITLRLQQAAVADFMAGPIATETVTVSSDAPLVDTTRIESGLRIDGSQVEELPINGRSITDLALLDSSVLATPMGNFYGERGSAFVVNGQSGRSNSFLVDGLDNNDQSSNTTMNAYLSGLAIGEFLLLKHQYAPEFGRASGGILNIVTERGGNEITGGGFMQGVAAGLNDQGDFVSQLPRVDDVEETGGRYAAGVRLGGPLVQDVSSYFVAYEHQQSDDLTPYTGITRDGVAGGWILAPSRDDNFFFRTDVNLGASNFLMTRLSLDDRRTTGLNVGGNTTPESGFAVDERDVQLMTSLTSVLSPRVLNEARLLLGRSTFDQQANSDRPGVSRPSGSFGGNNLNAQARDEDRIQFVDNITFQTGLHALKFGVDVLHSRTNVSTRFNPNGNFQYSTDDRYEPGDCGDLDVGDVVQGKPKAAIPCPGQIGVDDDGDGVIDEPGFVYTYPFVFQFIEGKPEAKIDDTRLSVFAQDTWQVSEKLVLNYGARYDLSTFTLPDSARVDSIIPNGGAGRDSNNVAPRLGFAWTADKEGRFVVRGGSGIFYDKLVLGFPAVAAITSGTKIGLLFPQGLTLEITEDVVEQLGIKTIRQVLFFQPELTLRFSTGTELETPYTVQHSLGMEHAIGSHASWSANLTRALGYNLVVLRDLNPVIGISLGDPNNPVPVDPDNIGIPVHRDKNVGSIAAMVTEGRSWYTGLDLGWKWRGDYGAWYSVSYTFSKAIDMASDPLKGGITLPANSDDIAADRGRSDNDRRHRFVFSASSPLPWLGLRASGVVQAASGLPFNVTTGLDENIDGINTDRPPGVARNTGARTKLKPINDLRAENDLPPVRSLREPTFSQIDLRLSRPFGYQSTRAAGGTAPTGFGGEMYLQIFNLLDRENVGALEGTATSRRFGLPTGLAGPARTLELGFKLAF